MKQYSILLLLIGLAGAGKPRCHGQQPRLKVVLKGHAAWILSVAFSPDNKSVASSDRSGGIRVWEVATGQLRMAFKAAPWTTVAFSPTGNTLACADGEVVKLRALPGGEEKASLKGHKELILRVAFSRDGKLLASGSNDETVKIWDTATGREKATLQGHNNPVLGIAFSPDGKLFAPLSSCVGGGGLVKLWDAGTWKEKFTWRADTGVVVAFTPDSKLLVTTPEGDERPLTWDVRSGKKKNLVPRQLGWVRRLAFSPGGGWLATGDYDGTVKLWDTATYQERAALTGHHAQVSCLAFSSDGKLLASASRDGAVRLWNMC